MEKELTQIHQELREKYNPEGSTLRRMQMRMLDILLEVDRICKKYDLKYWLAGGTMLGAVRHKGFIPWDDDVDIEMLKEDYDKLIAILPEELPDTMVLQYMKTDPNYFYQFAKVRDRRSRMKENVRYDTLWKEQGIFIDIFPVEKAPRWVHKMSCATLGHIYAMYNNPRLSVEKAASRSRKLLKLNTCFIYPILRLIAKCVPVSFYDDALGIPYYVKRYPKKMFPLAELEFEGHMLPVMADYKEQLTAQYGNYMALPKNPSSEHTAEITFY